jgi:hypothetical protein
MKLTEQVNKASGLASYKAIANHIGDDPTLFSELIHIFLTGSWRTNQRVATPLILCLKQFPHLIEPHLAHFIANLRNSTTHDATKRNTLRILQDVEITADCQAEATEICFDLLTNNKTPIAIKVFAMTVLGNIAAQLPELKNELIIVIEDLLPYGSAGFVSRGSKIMKMLKS